MATELENMKTIGWQAVLLVFALAAPVIAAAADNQTAYNERAAARIAALFQSLDRNSDGAVTWEEAHGDLNFGPRFADMDINRDDVVTRQELERYLGQRYESVQIQSRN
jgi:hypothetical protein